MSATTNTVKHTPGKCPGCGTERANTGAPVWEDYCPNKECTHDRDEFRRFFAESRKAFARDQALRDAAPDLLAALLAVRTLGENDDEPDDYEVDRVAALVDAALLKAHGTSTPEAQS